MASDEKETVEGLLEIKEIYEPPKEIVEKAYVKNYDEVYQAAIKDPEKFWEEAANELEWFKKWNKVLEWDYPKAKWFLGAKVNIVHNALDRHMNTWRRNKVALYWEGQDGSSRTLSYADLYREVNRFANALKELGIKKGDRVTIYLPRIPEQMIAMLATAKIGAIHSVVYSGFSAGALKDRIIDAEAKVVVTADGGYYRNKIVPLKDTVDEIRDECPTLEHVVVVRRTGKDIREKEGDIDWNELVKDKPVECKTEEMDSEDPLFILYTSGTTGKPKGVLHVHGGYMVGVYRTMKWIFDIKDDDVYWCTADAGWITGHSYIVYGPLINGATSLMWEGAPDYPHPGIWWSLIEKYKVSIFYTTPTAIRALMRYGEEWPRKYDLSSLRILGSVGEPINPEAWLWFRKVTGDRCPIMDTWWQTETGMIMISPLPCVPLKPGSATKPFPGIVAEIVDKDGNKITEPNKGGYLVIRTPWPAMMRTIYKDPDRYNSYWETIPNAYHTGDMAKMDEDGYFWILGRADDVLKVSGYRLGTAEIESALVSHEAVAEAAVIGKPDPVKGEAIKAFVVLKEGYEPSDDLVKELKMHVREVMGPIAMPSEIEFRESLPKTRSGKIMRRLLKAQELGLPVGDTSTLED
ncbi:acetate--CoA ligase [Thermococci archaeon]|nr:MAG: acetate--CoA ligase [Thermococci archaeon]